MRTIVRIQKGQVVIDLTQQFAPGSIYIYQIGLTAEECFDLERQLAEARAKVLAERTEPRAHWPLPHLPKECMECTGVRIGDIVYHALECSMPEPDEQPEPETWRDREPML